MFRQSKYSAPYERGEKGMRIPGFQGEWSQLEPADTLMKKWQGDKNSYGKKRIQQFFMKAGGLVERPYSSSSHLFPDELNEMGDGGSILNALQSTGNKINSYATQLFPNLPGAIDSASHTAAYLKDTFMRNAKSAFSKKRMASGGIMDDGPGDSAPAGAKSFPNSVFNPAILEQLNTSGLIKERGFNTENYGDSQSKWGNKYKGYDYIDIDPNLPLDRYPAELRDAMATEDAFPGHPGRFAVNQYYDDSSSPVKQATQPRFVDKTYYASYAKPGSEAYKRDSILMDKLHKKMGGKLRSKFSKSC